MNGGKGGTGGKGGKGFNGDCYSCGKRGHKAWECRGGSAQAAEVRPETEEQQVEGIFEVGAVARYFTKVSVQNMFDAFEDDDAVGDGNETFPSRGHETFPSLGAPATAKKMFDGGRAHREAPRSHPRFTNSAALNGVSADNGVDRDTVEINAVAAGTK